MCHPLNIISGGQTGVDRAALDVALNLGVPCGGWCPANRQAEDGMISERYPLSVLSGAGYAQRTRKNVADSDGTLIFYFDVLSGGTANTAQHCLDLSRPRLLVDATRVSAEKVAALITEFVDQHTIKTLNVAGPRATKEARGYDYAYEALHGWLKPSLS